MKLEQVEVGQIVNTHGVRGEMKVQPWCDTPEQFLTFPTLYLDGTPVKPAAVRIGLSVLDAETGRAVGTIRDVLVYPANNVLVVKGEKEYLIPAVPAVIENTDLDANTMTVHLLKGMAADEN